VLQNDCKKIVPGLVQGTLNPKPRTLNPQRVAERLQEDRAVSAGALLVAQDQGSAPVLQAGVVRRVHCHTGSQPAGALRLAPSTRNPKPETATQALLQVLCRPFARSRALLLVPCSLNPKPETRNRHAGATPAGALPLFCS